MLNLAFEGFQLSRAELEMLLQVGPKRSGWLQRTRTQPCSVRFSTSSQLSELISTFTKSCSCLLQRIYPETKHLACNVSSCFTLSGCPPCCLFDFPHLSSSQVGPDLSPPLPPPPHLFRWKECFVDFFLFLLPVTFYFSYLFLFV